MTQEEATAKAEAFEAQLKAAQEQVAKAATKEELEAATKLVTDLAETVKGQDQSEAVKSLQATVKEQGEEITALLRNKGANGTQKTLVEEIKEKKDEITKLVKTGRGKVELKAATTRASIVNNTQSVYLPDIGQLGVKERSLYNILPKLPVSPGNHNGTIRYVDWDEDTIVRAAATVAEGGTFPESTAAFREYSESLVKVGDTLPVTEEFGEDEVTAAAELNMFLETNVNTIIDNKLINATGGADINGFLNQIPAYTPVASGIVSPNLKDLARKVRTAIVFNRGSKYNPDMLLANANTLDDLMLTKDQNDNYIFPNVEDIGSMAIVEDNNMPDNQIIIGDRRYARIYEMGGIELSEGTVNAQFAEDLKTIKARKRMLLLIRNVDRTGFLKVTDVDAAFTTLATA